MYARLNALAVALIAVTTAVQADVQYQYHQRIQGLKASTAGAPAEPETPAPSCTDPTAAAIGAQSNNFCGSEGVELFLAGTAGDHVVLFGLVNDSESSRWGYVTAYATNSGVPDCGSTAGAGTGRCAGYDDGQSYTAAMMGHIQHNMDAAKICADKGAGWYLPSLSELALLADNSAQIDLAGYGFSGSYWSSVENTSAKAWSQALPTASQGTTNKTYGLKVRCARSY